MPSLSHFLGHFFPPKPTFTEGSLPADLSGKVYVVTGANSGIGKDIARILHAKNAKVYILCRSEDKAREAIQDIEKANPSSKGALAFIACDLADLPNTKAAAEAFLAQEQRLDVLFNNAGVVRTQFFPLSSSWPLTLGRWLARVRLASPFPEQLRASSSAWVSTASPLTC